MPLGRKTPIGKPGWGSMLSVVDGGLTSIPWEDLFFCFELYSHFNVPTGTQPSIRVKCKYKRAWLSLALCEGCSQGRTSELALSWMGRVEDSEVALARARLGAWLVA